MELSDLGAGGKKSKRLDKLGFEPQISIQKMPHIMQSSGKGCPVACATMILNYAEIKITYKELQKIPYDWRQMDEAQLRGLIEEFGLKTVPIKNLDEAKNLLENKKPVVVFVNRSTYAKGDNHWIVLRGVKGRVFAISDPADKDIRRLEVKTLNAAMKRSKCNILFTIE